ncbi:glycosyltransferase family 2 protein [Loktanella salsilacus]|uniref:glycosyltransferase family 2 protein n=1 Tax=Loktanella salsilacus TaxID=195913 RepID=UPI0020B67074|nr:glycosyltransferase family 2 protein [Loktanella salsilacus]UTH46252.1 glycosyltransferase family 2 protein [Loktanella salsilacus]
MKTTAADGAFPDLSVIVPVFNAEAYLPALIDQIFSLRDNGLSVELICVDDASSDGSVAVLQELAQTNSGIHVIEQELNQGAGLARNLAWEQATGRYTMFFDADDKLHGSVMADAIRDMDANPEVDVAVFAYRYEREASASFTEMNYDDKRILDALLNGTSVAIGTIETMARLLTFTNYPWNKIIRTAHYKDQGMRFGRTKVNNDILGHWYSLILSRSIMVRSAVNCTHVVHPQGMNLTNAFGMERLSLFDALHETYDFLEARPAFRRRFAHHYWSLAVRLMGWVRPRLDPLLQLEAEMRYAQLLSRIDIGDLTRIRRRHSPNLANSIVGHLT